MAEAGQTWTQRRQRMQRSGDWAVARPSPPQANTDSGQICRQRPQAVQLDESTTTRAWVVVVAEPVAPADEEPEEPFDDAPAEPGVVSP